MYSSKRTFRRKRGILNLIKRNKKLRQKKKFDLTGRIKYIFVLISLFSIFNILTFMNSAYAQNLSSANIYLVGDCGSLLTYKGVPVKVSYVQYSNDGVDYPAYCLDKTKSRSRNNSLCSFCTEYDTRCRTLEKNC